MPEENNTIPLAIIIGAVVIAVAIISFKGMFIILNGESVFLKLDASNDPLTGNLELNENLTLDMSSLHFANPLVNGTIRFRQLNNLVDIDRFENGVWVNKDMLGGSLTTNKIFLKNVMPEILLLESDNTTKNNIIRRDTSSQGIDVGNYNGETFLTTSDRVLVRKKAAEVDAIVFALENVTLENVMNVTFNFTTADFEGIPFDGAINFNLTFKFDRNYTGRFHIKIFDIDFSLTLPIYETSSFFDFQQGFCCDAVLVSQNKSALLFNPPLILLSNRNLLNILSFSELVNITGGIYANESDQFIPFIGAGGILQQTSEVHTTTNIITGEMYSLMNGEDTIISAVNVYVNITENVTAFFQNGVNITNGKMTIITPGRYDVQVSIGASDGNNNIFRFAVAVDGIPRDNCQIPRKVAAVDLGAWTLSCSILVNATDIVTLMARNENNAENVLVSDMNMMIKRLWQD